MASTPAPADRPRRSGGGGRGTAVVGLVVLLAVALAGPAAARPGHRHGPPAHASVPGPPARVSVRVTLPGPPAHAGVPGPPVHAGVPGPPAHAAIPAHATPSVSVETPSVGGVVGPGRDHVDESAASGTGPDRAPASNRERVAPSSRTAAAGGAPVLSASSAPAAAGSVDAVGEPPDGPSSGEVAWAPGFALDRAAAAAAVAPRELTIPLLLLLGVGLFLILNARAGGRDPRLADAPLRSRGSLRFPSVGG